LKKFFSLIYFIQESQYVTAVSRSSLKVDMHIKDCDEIINQINNGAKEANFQNLKLTQDQLWKLNEILVGNYTLESLLLKNVNIGDKIGVTLLKTIKNCKQIKTLKLDLCEFSSKTFNILLSLIEQQLTYLSLLKCNLKVSYIESLSKALFNSSLVTLKINSNNIGNAGAEKIAEALKYNKTLKHLYCAHNNIWDEGAYILARALEINNTLLTLDLSVNNLRDKGKEALVEACKRNYNLIDIKGIYFHSLNQYIERNKNFVKNAKGEEQYIGSDYINEPMKLDSFQFIVEFNKRPKFDVDYNLYTGLKTIGDFTGEG
jgi:hypothetical protein